MTFLLNLHKMSSCKKVINYFSLAFIKPDSTAYPFICWSVIESILSSKINIASAKWHKMSRVEAESFYAVHKGRFFYERLVRHVTSGWLFAMILTDDGNNNNITQRWRDLMGGTKVFKTIIDQPNTLRGRFGLTDTRNVCHGSDSVQNALIESKYFFPDVDVDSQLLQQQLSVEELRQLIFHTHYVTVDDDLRTKELLDSS